MGTTNSISLATLPAGDQIALGRLYDLLVLVRSAVEPFADDPPAAFASLREAFTHELLAQAHAAASVLGQQLDGSTVAEPVRKAFHDVRGGSLMALLMHVELVLDGEAEPLDAQRILLLVRDQLKMMRNAVNDLDPELYAADMDENDHSVDLLREKWSNVAYRVGARSVDVSFACSFEGRISQRCMEFSALDRVFYNLVNNAARFTADGQVHVHVRPVDAADDTHVRVAVVNRISAEQRDALRHKFGSVDLGRLFAGGFTTGGHGIGLRICGDFIVHGYELSSLDQAVQHGYLGARIIGDHFVAWFHWPGRREVAGSLPNRARAVGER